jgi:hypothetical protein
MWPILIIVSPPFFNLLPGILQTQKPRFIQALQTETGIKGLDVSVIRRLARSGEVQLNMIPVSLQVHVLRDKLWSVIYLDNPRSTMLCYHFL